MWPKVSPFSLSSLLVLGTPFVGAEGSQNFLDLCLDLRSLGIGLQCHGLSCRGDEGLSVSLEELKRQSCSSELDCRPQDTGMQCLQGRCGCPPYQAYNLSSCSCQPSSMCPPSSGGPCPHHNGGLCADSLCSCYSSPTYSSLLVEPLSLFCVLPLSPEDLVAPTPLHQASSPGLTALSTIAGLLCAITILTVAFLAYRKYLLCEKGDYTCDTPEAELPEVHIAAWDHPSLDYIPKDDEDNIVFTLCQAKDNVRMSNASTIHVMDDEKVTLPGDDHDNMAYVDDDDPRHD